jgi:hypothetical protein
VQRRPGAEIRKRLPLKFIYIKMSSLNSDSEVFSEESKSEGPDITKPLHFENLKHEGLDITQPSNFKEPLNPK